MIKEILEDLFQHIMDDEKDGKEMQVVGMVSDALLMANHELQQMKDEFEQDQKMRVRELTAALKRQVTGEFRERERELSSKHLELWQAIYRELDLNPEQHYSMNKKTGNISTEKKYEGAFSVE